jgi:phosphoesterase RecJ-like protein
MKTIEQQIFETIDKAKKILIVFDRSWTGDAVASALALRLWLQKNNKEVDMAAEKPSASSVYSFLPGFSSIKPELDNLRKFIISLDITNAEVSQIEYEIDAAKLNFIISPKSGWFKHEDISSQTSGFKYDLIITLATPDFESLGSIYDQDTEFFFDTTVINIDNQASNDNYGQINLVNVNAVATSEIIYDLLQSKNIELEADMATCLLAGLITATKSFKTANITPRTLTIASELISRDGRREEIINALYRSRQLNVLKLWGLVLTNLQSTLDNKIIWSLIKAEDFSITETEPANLTDVIEELIVNMPQAQVIILSYETSEPKSDIKKVQAIIYSVKNIDALFLAQPFLSQGTKTSALVSLDLPLTEANETLVKSISEKIKRLES